MLWYTTGLRVKCALACMALCSSSASRSLLRGILDAVRFKSSVLWLQNLTYMLCNLLSTATRRSHHMPAQPSLGLQPVKLASVLQAAKSMCFFRLPVPHSEPLLYWSCFVRLLQEPEGHTPGTCLASRTGCACGSTHSATGTG